MKKLKNTMKRIATLVLSAVLLTNSFPTTAFAAGIDGAEPAIVMDEELSENSEEVSAGESGEDAFEEALSESSEEISGKETAGEKAEGNSNEQLSDKESTDEENDTTGDAVTPSTVPVSDDTEGDDKKDYKEEKEEYPAFEESKTINGIKISVSADGSVFPEGATLSVEKVSKAQEKEAQEAVESERDEDQNVAASYTYDIKVLDKDGNEVQPTDQSKVKVSFTLDEVADSNLETNIYHITYNEVSGTENAQTDGADNLTAEKLEVETDGDTATAETDGFSLYTVEFTYNNLQYVLNGDSSIELSEILDKVGLTGEASAVEVSDESLFSAKKCKTTADGKTPEKDGVGEPIEDENGTWFVFAHQAFNTEEWMKVTIGGVVYEITVTDTNGEQSVTYTISHVGENGNYIYSLEGSDGSSKMLYDAKGTNPTKVTLEMGDDITFDVDAGGNVFSCGYTTTDCDMLGFTDSFITNDYDFTITSKTRIIQHVQIDGMGYVNAKKVKTTLEADGNDKTITVHWEGGDKIPPEWVRPANSL